ncbi:type II toxin-antitoxin system RelE/ParE family toxin [Acaryochloris sp. IP29b_bin.137]|uniref:type II toxin-antitoxin system RelE/ParE family toxin n=1 Tax=Acaryochloris sp. IP29b_bin.137 TaxID=2969217 RepID=UPI0026094AB5|nr:type II toxin-antitoxin system RelE/ParE family toxin [Acaryochloris sp. IP29b_bin.137]
MNSYSFSEKAVQDLDDICGYIAQQNPAAASKLFDAIRSKCRQVAQYPNMGKPYDRLSSHLRGFSVGNYIIFYYPRPDGIDIARVLSGYRDLEDLF